MANEKMHIVLGGLRLAMSWIFLWPFFDKLFGLGFATTLEQAVLNGGSPTYGFLTFGTHGPLAGLYQSMAGNIVVDWLFMAGLLLIGLSLLLGIGVRIAGYSGALLLFLMWSAALPPEHNPILDEHVVYLLVLIGFAFQNAGDYLGLGTWWKNTAVVKRYPILQ